MVDINAHLGCSKPWYIASCSFGKDSLAMVLWLINKSLPLDEVVFYDTGAEFDAIYKIRDKMIPVLRSQQIKYTELHPARPFFYDMLDKPVYSAKNGRHKGYGWCGGACRWGTAAKNAALDRYKTSLGIEIYEYVGIAADETKRIKNKHYPLVDWGKAEKDCLDFCRSEGWKWIENGKDGDVDLYEILDRVSCWCCANKNLKELRAIHDHLPAYWEKLKRLQDQINKPLKRYKQNGIPYGNVYQLDCRFAGEKE